MTTVRAELLTPEALRANLSDRIPEQLVVAGIGALSAGALAGWGINEVLGSVAAVVVAALVTTGGMVWGMRYLSRRSIARFAQYSLALSRNGLYIRGDSQNGPIDCRIPLTDIRAVGLGDQFLGMDFGLSAYKESRIARDHRLHTLHIGLVDRHVISLLFAGIAFERASLGRVLTALKKRGITVKYRALAQELDDAKRRQR